MSVSEHNGTWRYSKQEGKKYSINTDNREYLLEEITFGRYKMIHYTEMDDELLEYYYAELEAYEEAEERWMIERAEEEEERWNDPDYVEEMTRQFEEWERKEEEYLAQINRVASLNQKRQEKGDGIQNENNEDVFIPVLDKVVQIENNFDAEKESQFPIHVLHDPIANFVKEISRMFSIPYEFSAVPALVTVATAIGNNIELQFNSTLRQKAIIYACVISQSSSGKSPAQKFTTAPLTKKQTRLEKEYKAKVAEYTKAMKNKELEEKPDEPRKPLNFITTNTTIEKLFDMLGKNEKGIMMICDEFMTFYNNLNAYKSGGGDKEMIMSAWSNTYTRLERLTRETDGIESPYLNIVGNMTPSSIQKIMEGDNVDNGFIHRILFSCPLDSEMVRTSTNGIDESVQKEYDNLITTLHDIEDEKTFVLNEQAQNVYLQYEQFISKQAGMNGILRSSYSKIKEYSLRFALILHSIEYFTSDFHSDKISAETMHKAIKICEYFRSQVKVLFNKANITGGSNENIIEKATEKAIRVLENHANKKGSNITKRELQQALHIKSDEIGGIISILLEKEMIKVDSIKKTARGESVTYEILM